MKKFLEEEILFPKKIGWIPYFWLIFLIPVLSDLGTMPLKKQVIILFLLLLFLKAYREGYESNKWAIWYVIIQLIISVIYQFLGMTGLFIFTAWQIGFLSLRRDRFYLFLGVYYAFCFINIVSTTLWLVQGDAQSIGSLLIVLLFAIFSPLVSRSMNESIYRTTQLNRENKRLEALIRKEERERIARDLHDNLGQSFSIITLKTELAQKLLAKQPEKVSQELTEIAQISRNNLQLVRQIVNGLENRSIAKALLEEEKLLSAASIYLSTEGEEIAENWPIELQTIFASCIKEAFTNIIRHSKAQFVQCVFRQSNQYYELSIHDNGIGFLTIDPASHGLSGMMARMKEKNGTFDIINGDGTKLHFRIPLEEERER